jgi:hypothetical protein
VWWRAVTPTFKISLVLMAFCELVNLGAGGVAVPEKYFFSVATPELIHKSDGSLTGIKDFDGTIKCCLDSKKSSQVWRISSVDRCFM